MTATTVAVNTGPDGTLVIQLRGVLNAEHAADLRHALIHAIRHTRPSCLILDLAGVREIDAISLGALAAACHLGDVQHVAVYLDHPPESVARQLAAAGVAHHRLRDITR
ncbi:hypothetical protein GCM10010112_22260 [Actinoplanes lobatus]|uniref:Anti-anti-sigma factor n=1 Tax=Actinoplanes lobatus TaxID=113568 RepID=A0A7W7HIR7_9ACTN|nr:STAS domain-containing protein [Actinoplanes lobatus]MBB4751269.1 anti-anti-sigma factor [Actinoplanes lobatus]GGN63214.1 hypothetical protein GCM10010112_22260 [Actinoplanes lobatus]GIE44789.1 hypothetical protein Alo02nite_76870 [Actinoplanes lobatus]